MTRSTLLVTLLLAVSIVACVPPSGTTPSYYTGPSYGSAPMQPPATAPAAPPVQPAAQPSVEGDVYLNGIRLDDSQRALLAEIIQEPYMPAGRWYITNDGMMGREGEAPMGNIRPYVEAYVKRHGGRAGGSRGGSGGGTVMVSRGGVGDSTLVGDGKCMIMSTPFGSVESGDCR